MERATQMATVTDFPPVSENNEQHFFDFVRSLRGLPQGEVHLIFFGVRRCQCKAVVSCHF